MNEMSKLRDRIRQGDYTMAMTATVVVLAIVSGLGAGYVLGEHTTTRSWTGYGTERHDTFNWIAAVAVLLVSLAPLPFIAAWGRFVAAWVDVHTPVEEEVAA